jgi:hypothetical protein
LYRARCAVGERFPEQTLTTYSYIEGVLREILFVSAADDLGVRLGGADLVLGTHPVADSLRILGLPKRALMSTWMGTMRGSFGAARAV